MSDVWLFVLAIVKTALYTGIGPAAVVAVCYEVAQERKKGKLIPFPGKAECRKVA